MKIWKKILIAIFSSALIIAAYQVYTVNINYNFKTITEGKVYKSGVIPPENIDKYLKNNNIKTVIDLRIGNVIDPLNPSSTNEILKEKEAVEKVGVNYYNIPSKQIPSKENLEQFYSILDNKNAYPILIHCYHGTGRAILYSALYRVEYENHTPEQARMKTRFPVLLSSFDNGTPKGEWLKNYIPRIEEKNKDTKLVLANPK